MSTRGQDRLKALLERGAALPRQPRDGRVSGSMAVRLRAILALCFLLTLADPAAAGFRLVHAATDVIRLEEGRALEGEIDPAVAAMISGPADPKEEYVLRAEEPTGIIIALRTEAARPLSVTVTRTSGEVIGTFRMQSGKGATDTQASRMITLPEAGEYRVAVRGSAVPTRYFITYFAGPQENAGETLRVLSRRNDEHNASSWLSRDPHDGVARRVRRPPPPDPRFALVIGNSDYGARLGHLENPVNDAKAMAERLEALGFKVRLLVDADRNRILQALREHADQIRSAGPGTTSLFYYAGHGFQASGLNYLLPIGAIGGQRILDQAIPAAALFNATNHPNVVTRIVILDACRNTPKGIGPVEDGLAKMDAPSGSFIAYSTAPGDVAADGEGRNSPFTSALVEELKRADQPIEVTFRNVRKRVIRATGGQVPWDASSLVAGFQFAS
jgi:hypothetical protein